MQLTILGNPDMTAIRDLVTPYLDTRVQSEIDADNPQSQKLAIEEPYGGEAIRLITNEGFTVFDGDRDWNTGEIEEDEDE